MSARLPRPRSKHSLQKAHSVKSLVQFRIARDMAAHASIRTTQLYDRRNKAVKMDDVVLINLRGGKNG